MKSAPAIVFDYRPSRWLIAAVVAMTATGLATLMFSAMPLWARLVAAVLVCGYAAFSLQGFRRNRVSRAAWYEAGHWRLVDNAGVEHLAELQTGIVRGNWIVLRLRRNDGPRVAIVLGPDNSDAELRRRLRVRLSRAREETA